MEKSAVTTGSNKAYVDVKAAEKKYEEEIVYNVIQGDH